MRCGWLYNISLAVWISFCLNSKHVYCMVDLYLSKEEMKRILNEDGQLDYVSNGTVNVNAINYSRLTPVWPNVTRLHFHWKTSSPNNIFYSISINTSDSGVLSEPYLNNYDARGVIPKKETGFAINVKCVDGRNTFALLHIDIAYTWPSITNKTNIRLVRRKICSLNAPLLNDEKEGGRLTTQQNRLRIDQAESAAYYYGNFGAAGHIFYVAIGCVFGFIMVVAGLVVMYFVRKKPAGYELTAATAEQAQNSVPSTRIFPMDIQEDGRARYPSQSSASKYSSYSNGATGTSVSLWKNGAADSCPTVCGAVMKFEPKDVDVYFLLENLAVDRSRIKPMRLELEGTFGEMFSGYLVEESGDAEDVLIKTVKIGGASELQVSKFLSEALAFTCLPSSPNVACVLAACSPGPEDMQPMLCYSHRGFGNLKKFLTKCRGAEASHSLVTQDLVHMALHIIRGVMHLHQNKILHSDLATRNCVINDDLVVQVCDTGLSRDLFSQDYHCLGDNENRPIKWLAIEALERHDFSTASDVWAFGVTLWELITLAQQPYADVDPFEMQPCLLEGQRLGQPYNCPDEMYMLMYCCWNNHPEARPTFMNLLKALEHFCAQLNQYI